MTDIDTSADVVAKVQSNLEITARVGSANYDHSALMDEAARTISALSADLEAMLARAEQAEAERDRLRVGRDTMGELWSKSEADRAALQARAEHAEARVAELEGLAGAIFAAKDACDNLPTDRGGSNGPKGTAINKLMMAMAALRAALSREGRE